MKDIIKVKSYQDMLELKCNNILNSLTELDIALHVHSSHSQLVYMINGHYRIIIIFAL